MLKKSVFLVLVILFSLLVVGSVYSSHNIDHIVSEGSVSSSSGSGGTSIGGSGQSCQTYLDCPNNANACINNRCSTCNSHDQCINDRDNLNYCVNSVCAPRWCNSQSPCPLGSRCSSIIGGIGLCRRGCTDDSHCGGYWCIQGQCLNVDCRDDSHCPSGDSCYSYQCTETFYCQTNQDCTSRFSSLQNVRCELDPRSPGGQCVWYENGFPSSQSQSTILTLVANPTTINLGQTVNLSWTSAGVHSCRGVSLDTTSNYNNNVWNSPKLPNGFFRVTPRNPSTTYWIHCNNSRIVGDTVSSSVTININSTNTHSSGGISVSLSTCKLSTIN